MLNEQESPCVLSSFSGKNCTGNHHIVIAHDKDFDENSLKAYSDYSQIIEPIILVVFRRFSKSNQILSQKENKETSKKIKSAKLDLRFFHFGQRVQFCGSGLLALGYHLDKHSYWRSTKESHTTLLKKNIRIHKTQERYAITCEIAESYSPAPAYHWLSMLGAKPQHSTLLQSGYLILEFSNAEAIRQITPKFDLISTHVQPAIIATALVNDASNEDYVMRYFAPQCGNDEDSATGSANLILMKYWQKKLNKNTLRGKQLSDGGGIFYGDINNNNVTLSGDVSIISIPKVKKLIQNLSKHLGQ